LATASPILIASAAVFHKDQFSGPWNSWPTLRTVDLFGRHKVNHHLYADVQHIYLHNEPSLAYTGLTRLVDCFSELIFDRPLSIRQVRSPLLEDCNMQLRRALRIRLGTTAVRHLRFTCRRPHHEPWSQSSSDDTQLFLAIKASSISADLSKLKSCSLVVKGWFVVNNLRLNAKKSDVMLIGTSAAVARRRSYFGNIGCWRKPKARGSNQVTRSYPGQSFDFCCSCYSCVQGL